MCLACILCWHAPVTRARPSWQLLRVPRAQQARLHRQKQHNSITVRRAKQPSGVDPAPASV